MQMRNEEITFGTSGAVDTLMQIRDKAITFGTTGGGTLCVPSTEKDRATLSEYTYSSGFENDAGSVLLDGDAGQIKVLYNMGASAASVTVASAGWVSSGLGKISLLANSRGSGCTLQFLGGKWYCVGNNGAQFTAAP